MNKATTDQSAAQALLERFGYEPVPAKLGPLMAHLSALDGRASPWTADYLLAVARGQLKASHRLLDAIVRCMNGHPAPQAMVSRRCECGVDFIPNVPWRKECYACRKVRSGKSSTDASKSSSSS